MPNWEDTVINNSEKLTCSLIGRFPYKFVRDIIDEVCLHQAEISFKAGQRAMAEELYADVICPMCYMINPQHATADNGVACKSCQDKEGYCGKSNLRSG